MYCLDCSLPEQYGVTMENIFSNQLTSYESRDQLVVTEIIRRVPVTLSLAIGGSIIWLLLGMGFGALAAIKAGTRWDKAVSSFAVVGISVPTLWTGSLLLYYLCYQLDIFPLGSHEASSGSFWDWAKGMLLPWMTMAMALSGYYIRLLRSTMIDTFAKPHVLAARARGLTERRVVTRHVLRNSLIPVVSLWGLDFGAYVGGGALIIEQVFNLEGVGKYAVSAIASQDLPVVLAVTLYGALFITLFSAIVDILYAYLDPRIRSTT